MRNLLKHDTIQIEITNYCYKNCSNCTRFCGHVKEPFFMDMDTFKKAVDSMVNYPKMTGIQGGEPLMHPDFEAMCEYLHSKIDPDRCGLWTTFPLGYEKYRDIIVKTFKHVFLNDHTIDTVYHAPVLVGPEEVFKDEKNMFLAIDNCWGQESWSAAINPRGAFFCEMAGSLAMLYEDGYGWEVSPGWWMRTPKDFTSQIEKYCVMCGLACPLDRRSSNDQIDDISPKHYERLKDFSNKVKRGEYKIHDLKTVHPGKLQQLGAYKNTHYRNVIAARYGIVLVVNSMGFWSPYIYDSNVNHKDRPLSFRDILNKRGMM